jgi:lactoylglutathione lyase
MMKFCWTTVNVTDMENSLGFYRDIVGLELDRRFKPVPHMEIAFLGNGETQVELIHNAEGGNTYTGKGISLGFEVESLDGF